jgi:hypothetical protein
MYIVPVPSLYSAPEEDEEQQEPRFPHNYFVLLADVLLFTQFNDCGLCVSVLVIRWTLETGKKGTIMELDLICIQCSSLAGPPTFWSV